MDVKNSKSDIRSTIFICALFFIIGGCTKASTNAASNDCQSVRLSVSLQELCIVNVDDFMTQAKKDSMFVLDNHLLLLVRTTEISDEFLILLTKAKIQTHHISQEYNSMGLLISTQQQLKYLTQQPNILRIEPQQKPRKR